MTKTTNESKQLKHRAKSKAWRDRMRAEGRCITCGKPRTLNIDGTPSIKCRDCAERQRTYWNAFQSKRPQIPSHRVDAFSAFCSVQTARIARSLDRLVERIQVARNDGMDSWDKHRDTDIEVRR